jgi:hypothetical protein
VHATIPSLVVMMGSWYLLRLALNHDPPNCCLSE